MLLAARSIYPDPPRYVVVRGCLPPHSEDISGRDGYETHLNATNTDKDVFGDMMLLTRELGRESRWLFIAYIAGIIMQYIDRTSRSIGSSTLSATWFEAD